MPEIQQLIPDIYETIKQGGWFSPDTARMVSEEATARLVAQSNQDRSTGSLRLSRMGDECPRALWYSVNHPEMAEQLPPWATIKYSFGHLMEALAIGLSKAAGHTVVGEQDAIYVDGIRGHRDCVIDGCVVDVKSASSRAFLKAKDRLLENDDPFGYLCQLDGYVVGSREDPLVTCKDKGYLLVIDKQLGHMCLYEHTVRPDYIRQRIADYKSIVNRDRPPTCECETQADGKSGNIKLGTRASYSGFKYCCFPNLRTFLYANGPVYLTKVVRKPDVPEINRERKIVYN